LPVGIKNKRITEMPVYNFKCPNCLNGFDLDLPMSESKNAQACPDCGIMSKRLLSSNIQFALSGDSWPGKAVKVRGQMAEKNRKLKYRQSEHHPTVELIPNVDGEQVDSWADAAKLAKERGKNVASYEARKRGKRT